MSLSLSVLLTILFLSPGFAGFFGLSVAIRGRSVRRLAPAPNSLTFLVLVSLGAMAAHGAALLLFAAQDFLCRGRRCLRPGFDPDAYASLARLLGSARPEIRSATILYEMFVLLLLCAASFVIARAWTARDLRQGDWSYVGALLYRWLGPYARDFRGRDGAITAYVLTKMRHEGMALGYRGVVNEVSLNADGEINSITLYAVERFGLLLGEAVAPDRRTPKLSGLLGLVHIPGREIENVALTAFSFADAEAAEPNGAPEAGPGCE